MISPEARQSTPSRTHPNATTALSLCIALLAATIICAGLIATTSGRTQKPAPQLLNKINPNTASLASLRRLPGIGPTRAKNIRLYRRTFTAENNAPAFTKPSDLANIKNIGPLTVDNLRQYLIFNSARD